MAVLSLKNSQKSIKIRVFLPYFDTNLGTKVAKSPKIRLFTLIRGCVLK